jgi:hypothetical protein
LQFIVENYDNRAQLPQVIFFSQANPNSNQYNMELFKEDIRNYQKYSTQIFPLKHHDQFAFLGSHVLPFRIALFPTEMKLLIYSLQDVVHSYHNNNYTAPKSIYVINRYFAPGGIFLVTKELIYRHSKAYYERLLRMVNYAKFTEEGYLYERVWPMLFHSQCGYGAYDDCLLHRIRDDDCCDCSHWRDKAWGKLWEMNKMISAAIEFRTKK